MTRWLGRQFLLVAALAATCLLLLLGWRSQSVAAQAPADSKPGLPEQVLIMRTAGQPERRLKVIQESSYPDGEVVVEVKDMASGQVFTLPGRIAAALPRLGRQGTKTSEAPSTPTPAATAAQTPTTLPPSPAFVPPTSAPGGSQNATWPGSPQPPVTLPERPSTPTPAVQNFAPAAIAPVAPSRAPDTQAPATTRSPAAPVAPPTVVNLTPTVTLPPASTSSPVATLPPASTSSPGATLPPASTSSPGATLPPASTSSPVATLPPASTSSPGATLPPASTLPSAATQPPTATLLPNATLLPLATLPATPAQPDKRWRIHQLPSTPAADFTPVVPSASSSGDRWVPARQSGPPQASLQPSRTIVRANLAVEEGELPLPEEEPTGVARLQLASLGRYPESPFVRPRPGTMAVAAPASIEERMRAETQPLVDDLFLAVRPSVRIQAAQGLAEGRYGSRRK